MKRTVIICPVPYDKNTWYTEHVDDVCAYLKQQFGVFPEFAKIYHGTVAESHDVTPKSKVDIEQLRQLEGTFYVVIYPAWIQYIYYAVVAIMAAFSVYSILTMPKPQAQTVGSSNNELQGRSNKARLKGRIPDIYGKLRAYPDLAAVTYNYYNQNGDEIEECLMCLGRGHYQIHDVRDADTAAEGVAGMSVSIYDPDTSIIGEETIYRTGSTFTELPMLVSKSASINGQSLVEPSNTIISEDTRVYFMTGGIIKAEGDAINFTNFFKVGDGIEITGAEYGLYNETFGGVFTANSNNTLSVTLDLDLENVDSFKTLSLVGALFSYEVTSLDPETGEEIITTYNSDLSGEYEVESASKTQTGANFTYVFTISNPKQVNYNWNHITSNSFTATATLKNSVLGVTLDDTYSISAIQANQITLANVSIINTDWDNLDALYGGSTQGLSVPVTLDVVESRWVGWFEVDFEEIEQITLNFNFPQGAYSVGTNGKTYEDAGICNFEYQAMLNGNPTGAIYSSRIVKWAKIKNSFGFTHVIQTDPIVFSDGVRFRMSKESVHICSKTQRVNELKIKDVYVGRQLDKTIYPGVTMLRTRQVATSGALSMKERKLNCLVTRKLPVDGVGVLTATRDAGQVLINMALDAYIGRRTLSEVDVEQIKAEINKVKTYFGSSAPAEFSYTFDDAELSFEEQAGMVASACFSECYRYGNKLRMRFEQPQETSVLLFNHRNKVPQSEKRTYTFGIQKDYDGIKLEYTDPDDDERVNYYLSYNPATGEVTEDSSATNPLEITTSGIRNVAVAKTRAWREWNKLQYQRVSVDFDALDESELLMRNDRVLVADNTVISTQDGEVVSQNGFILTLSQNVEFKDGVDYYCFLQLADGSTQSILCHPGEMTNEIILTESPRLPLVIDPDRYVKTLYTVVESSQTDKQAFMLTEMSPNDEMTNRLTCINYDARYYEKDHTYI